MESLEIKRVHVMHSEMACSRRIETFDSFLGKETGVMIATDVAARGLGETFFIRFFFKFY